MSKTTPATIYYKTKVKGSKKYKENTIKFHAVVSEGHEVSTQVTKFPVQSGYEVSNNAIRRNRVVDLVGIFTNTLLVNTNQITYSNSNNSKEMFKALELLVQSATVCRVVTNLGIYSPVVFTKFKTKQGVGSVDSMEFNIVGEEVQVANLNVSSSPKELTFIDVEDSKIQALKDEFFAANLNFNDSAKISMTKAELGKDWAIKTWETSGAKSTTTFECVAYDPDADYYSYKTHTTNIQTYKTKFNTPSALIVPTDDKLLGGLIGASNCLLDKTINLTTNYAVDEFIKTPLGNLKNSIFGALKEVVSIGGTSLSQTLMGFATECVSSKVAEAFGHKDLGINNITDAENYATNQLSIAMNSIKEKGKELTRRDDGLPIIRLSPTTITKIASPFQGPLSYLKKNIGDPIQSGIDYFKGL